MHGINKMKGLRRALKDIRKCNEYKFCTDLTSREEITILKGMLNANVSDYIKTYWIHKFEQESIFVTKMIDIILINL